MKGMNAGAAAAARAAVLLLAAAVAAGDARAQAPRADTAAGLPLAEGTRVRIRAASVNRGRRIEGSVLRRALDTVVVDTAPDWRTHRFFGGSTIPLDSLRRVPVPVDSIRELQVGIGRSRFTSARRGLVRGAIIGGVIGALANTPQRNPSLRDMGEGFTVGLPIGAGVGLLYGVLFPGDRWRTVPLGPRGGARPRR